MNDFTKNPHNDFAAAVAAQRKADTEPVTIASPVSAASADELTTFFDVEWPAAQNEARAIYRNWLSS